MVNCHLALLAASPKVLFKDLAPVAAAIMRQINNHFYCGENPSRKHGRSGCFVRRCAERLVRQLLELIIVRICLICILALTGGPGHAVVVGQNDAVTVASLPANDLMRQASQSVGTLVAQSLDGSASICTAAIISDRHILTASHCVNDTQSLTAFFGEGSRRESFRVQAPAVEMDRLRNYAVLDIEGTPSRKFSATKLLLRIPIQGESAFLLSINSSGELTAAGGCSVRGTTTDGLILHDCDSAPGSSGALLFSTKDLAVLGLHVGSADQLNRASPMYAIGLASALVRNLATIKPPIIDFRTVGSRPSEIASDFRRLYLSLHNEGRLPLKSYTANRFSTIEEVFRSLGLFHGSPFPIELESIACDLNPNVCWRERVEATAQDRKSGSYVRDAIPDPARPSGYSRPSSGNWSVASPASLWLPSVRVEEQRGWFVYRKRAGEDIERVVKDDFGACDLFDGECRRLIIGMNRDQEERLTPAYSGVILLPKPSYSVRGIDISTAAEKGGGPSVEITPTSSRQNGTLILQANDAATGSKSERPKETEYRILRAPASAGTPASLDAVLKSLGTTASGSARIVTNQALVQQVRCKGSEANPCEMDTPDLSVYQQKLMEGIYFPYAKLSDYPPVMRAKPRRIGIIDTDLDLGHCAFDQSRLKPIDTDVRAAAPMVAGHTPCRWLKPYREATGSHGTHVAGLMVGKIGDGFFGLNPFAILYAGQVNTTTIGQQVQVSNLELSNLLRTMLDKAGGLDVVNLSLFYERESIGAGLPGGMGTRPRGDPVLEVIRNDGLETLFVVAAGNDGDDFTAICDLRPACIDLANVISVAALDGSTSDAALLRSDAGGSNYGSRVHVAAPGLDVLSLVNGNYLGLLSGTSQAAPQVAAVASILRTLRPKASPGDIKERLITCSRELPRPVGTADDNATEVFGGRIDSACTLAPEGEGLLEEKDSKGSYRVRALKAGAQPDIVFEAVSGDYSIAIPPRQLRGLRASISDREELTVFYKRSPENPNEQLSREGRLSVKAEAKIFVEVWDDRSSDPPAWKMRPFLVHNIARFVAPMRSR